MRPTSLLPCLVLLFLAGKFLTGSAAGQSTTPYIITPTGITSYTGGTDVYPADNLIDGSGLSETPDFDNFETVTHSSATADNVWATATRSGDYFASSPPLTRLICALDGNQFVSGMIVWGYWFTSTNNSEAKTFRVRYSADGLSYSLPIVLTSEELLGANAIRLNFPENVRASSILIDISDNHYGDNGAEGGGSQIGLGEVRFFYEPEFFEDSGDLNTARRSHSTTLLLNGKVLVSGGSNSSDATLASAELYDSSTDTWSATGALNTARGGQSATLLPDGKVLVTGGYNSSDGTLKSTELYDPSTGIWTQTGDLHTARQDHTATLLPDGKVIVSGGRNSSDETIASAEIFDSSMGTWTSTGDLDAAREGHSAALLSNGKVLVAGGNSSTEGTLASAELYDPISGVWTVTGELDTARYEHTSTRLPDGRVLVAGGGQCSRRNVSEHRDI